MGAVCQKSRPALRDEYFVGWRGLVGAEVGNWKCAGIMGVEVELTSCESYFLTKCQLVDSLLHINRSHDIEAPWR